MKKFKKPGGITLRHYEIVFLIHPDQSNQTDSLLKKFATLVSDSGGVVHRSENIGNKKLAYPIQEQFKATYALMNVECAKPAIEEIKNSFKFNDAIIRELVIAKKIAETEESALTKQREEEEEETLSKEGNRKSPISSVSEVAIKKPKTELQEKDKSTKREILEEKSSEKKEKEPNT